MLKIKDEVDLKELERFGFRENEDKTYYAYQFDTNVLFVNCDNRYIWLSNECSIIPNIIYDFMELGLVEKVVEDEN